MPLNAAHSWPKRNKEKEIEALELEPRMNREKVGPTDTPPYHSSIYHIHTLIVSNHFEPKALSNATFPILNFPLEDAEMMEP